MTTKNEKKQKELVERTAKDTAEQASRYAKFEPLFASEDGQEVLAQIMELGSVHLPTIYPDTPIDTNQLIAKEAVRSFCVNLCMMAKKDPAKIIEDATRRINRLRGHTK